MTDGLGDGPKLRKSDVLFMRAVEQQNIERVQKLKRMRKNNNITGICLGVFAAAIYGYSIWAVKQETFLDDFNRPEKVAK